MGELRLPTTDNLENHAAYLKSWLSAMAEDPKFIFRASAQASKATDFLLSFSRTTEDKAEPLSPNQRRDCGNGRPLSLTPAW